jgi:hypothetical protein
MSIQHYVHHAHRHTYFKPWELLAATKVLNDASEAVVAAMTAPLPEPHSGRRLIQVIRNHQHTLRRHLTSVQVQRGQQQQQ